MEILIFYFFFSWNIVMRSIFTSFSSSRTFGSMGIQRSTSGSSVFVWLITLQGCSNGRKCSRHQMWHFTSSTRKNVHTDCNISFHFCHFEMTFFSSICPFSEDYSGILCNRAENLLFNRAENYSPPLCGELFSALMRITVLRPYAENCSPPLCGELFSALNRATL